MVEPMVSNVSLIRLIAGLLGVRFDDLWRREERRSRIRRITRSLEVAGVGQRSSRRSRSAILIGLGRWSALTLAPFSAAASDVRILAREAVQRGEPCKVILDEAVTGPELTRWNPASNVVLRVSGTDRDGAERSLSWHLILTPGFTLKKKPIQFAAPSTREILAHQGWRTSLRQRVHGRGDRRARVRVHTGSMYGRRRFARPADC